jgi:hypothetical protein
MTTIRNLGELADAAKGAADRAAESTDDALSFVEKSNLRIAALEKVPLQKMTLTEFLAWEEHQTDRHEFLGGETFAMAGGTARYNRVILNLASRIGDHLDGTPCQVFTQSMKVQFADGVLYPDVVVACGKAEAGEGAQKENATSFLDSVVLLSLQLARLIARFGRTIRAKLLQIGFFQIIGHVPQFHFQTHMWCFNFDDRIVLL